MDAIHYKVREEGRIINRAAYVILGVTLDGTKDILSITIGANESSKFWLGMLNDLKNRGVKEVLFFCVDGLAGFKEAINVVYSNEEVQRRIIHMLSKDEKIALLKQYEESGLSKSSWCRENHISSSTFYAWCEKYSTDKDKANVNELKKEKTKVEFISLESKPQLKHTFFIEIKLDIIK